MNEENKNVDPTYEEAEAEGWDEELCEECGWPKDECECEDEEDEDEDEDDAEGDDRVKEVD